MVESEKDTAIDKLEQGKSIVKGIASIKPFTSLSVVLSSEGFDSLEYVIKILDQKMGGNMPKMKKSVMQTLSTLESSSPGEATNFNLDEYEIKAMNKALTILRKIRRS